MLRAYVWRLISDLEASPIVSLDTKSFQATPSCDPLCCHSDTRITFTVFSISTIASWSIGTSGSLALISCFINCSVRGCCSKCVIGARRNVFNLCKSVLPSSCFSYEPLSGKSYGVRLIYYLTFMSSENLSLASVSSEMTFETSSRRCI